MQLLELTFALALLCVGLLLNLTVLLYVAIRILFRCRPAPRRRPVPLVPAALLSVPR